jgi:16S rRNA (guanine527-N7)-methyltransferase
VDEASARDWVAQECNVPRETLQKLDRLVEFLAEENLRQNLVAAPSLDNIWQRHICDSAQLLRFDPSPEARWLDLGSGAGFPGLIVSLLRSGPVILVEERRLRVEFLRNAIELLGIGDRCRVIGSRVERVEPQSFAVISARAFAPLDQLLTLASRFSTETTRWILPKGRKAQSELEAAQASWQGDFRLEPSVTDADARIIVAERVRRRGKEKRRA